MLLTDKVAVITGSAVGIGRNLSITLAGRGACIAGFDIDTDGNEETAASVAAAGGEFLAITCDIADKFKVRSSIDQVMDRFGQIDILINNAAVYENSLLLGGSFESQSAAYDQAMGACAMGAYYCSLACAPIMAEAGGGNIINMITEHIKEDYYLKRTHALGYDCAKFSMWRQVEAWDCELSKHHIRVNGLAFGATDTPMLRAVAEQIADKAMRPEDVSQAVVNVLAHGEGGPSGEIWFFGPTGTPRADSLTAIATIGPGGKSA